MAFVLILEDDAPLRRGMGACLRDLGHRVLEMGSAEEARRGMEKELPDLISLDLALPGEDGLDLLRWLKETTSTRNLPVLVVSGRDRVQDRILGLETGADDYLVKPFDLSELFARLRALIRRAAARPAPKIVLGDVAIDTRARSVAVGGQAVALTATEYAILEYLALQQGKVVSRTELFDHVFDERADSLSNLLDVHVYNIRRKLARPLIATRRGHGYCIEN